MNMVKERGCHENHTPIRIIKIPLVLLKSHLFSDHAFCKFFAVGGKLSINILSNSNCIGDEKSLLVPTGQCSKRFEPRTEFLFFFFYRLAETEKKKVETKKGEQEEKIVTGKQQGAESCAASCSASTFDFHCRIKLVSFRSASSFANQIQSSNQLQISFSQLQSSDQLQLLQNCRFCYVEKRKIPNVANEVEALGIIREGSRTRVWIEE